MMGMRVALMLALAGVWLAGGLPVRGQSIMNANRAAAMAPLVEHAQPGEQALRCDVAALKPTLNYSFRFQSGYTVSVPMNQYRGKGHFWSIVMQIKARAAGARAVYLGARIPLPEIPKTNADLRVGGGFLLGEGVYDVHWLMRDDTARVCRKTWRLDVHPSRGERSVQVAMPASAVWEMGLRGGGRCRNQRTMRRRSG